MCAPPPLFVVVVVVVVLFCFVPPRGIKLPRFFHKTPPNIYRSTRSGEGAFTRITINTTTAGTRTQHLHMHVHACLHFMMLWYKNTLPRYLVPTTARSFERVYGSYFTSFTMPSARHPPTDRPRQAVKGTWARSYRRAFFP